MCERAGPQAFFFPLLATTCGERIVRARAHSIPLAANVGVA